VSRDYRHSPPPFATRFLRPPASASANCLWVAQALP